MTNLNHSIIRKVGSLKIDKLSISRICKQFNITKLYMFGSCARGDEGEFSDVDLLAVFGDYDDPLSQFVDAMNAFADVFKRRVDLVEESGIKSEKFTQNIVEDRVLLYEA